MEVFEDVVADGDAGRPAFLREESSYECGPEKVFIPIRLSE